MKLPLRGRAGDCESPPCSPRLGNRLGCLFPLRGSCFLADCFHVFPSKHLFSLEASRYAMLGFVSPWICVYELRFTVEMPTISSCWRASSLGPAGNILSSLNGPTRLYPLAALHSDFLPAPDHSTTSRFSSAIYKWNIHSCARYCVVHCAFPACESSLNHRCLCTPGQYNAAVSHSKK